MPKLACIRANGARHARSLRARAQSDLQRLFATALSLALVCSTPLALIACVVQAIALEIQVRAVEEPHLARVHGDAYRQYAARVGRFVPGHGLWSPSTANPASEQRAA